MKNLIDEENADVVTVKGKNNFHCVMKHMRETGECVDNYCELTHVDEAPCETGYECEIKSSCTYYEQRNYGRYVQVVITNYAYGLAVLNYMPEAYGLGHFDVIVSDEGHILDQQLEEFIKVKLNYRRVKQLFNLDLPRFDNKDDVPRWKEWVESHEEELEEAGREFYSVSREDMTKAQARRFIAVQHYLAEFRKITTMDYNWVVEADSNGVEFQPVWVREESHKVLFKYSNRHIIMSGTIPSASELGKKVGLKVSDFKFLRLPYTFPPENRPIIFKPRVSLARKVLDENLPTLVTAMDEEFEEWLKLRAVKLLIHSKTYKIGSYIKDFSSFRDIMFTHNTANRLAVLEEFKTTSSPAVLVSPSFDKAVDLPGDQCELIFVPKIPYEYMGTKVMRKRMAQNRRYYIHETLMTLIQMAGRGTRSDVDVCPTIVFDSAGPGFISQARSMIPKGIMEAIQYEEEE